ncbi:hypothetical protein DO97_00365 [Neosynechococcus sphagnicola sy1]|uniref:Uncharacterized protein n=1 Tax=Neosynechococcus sphagnicola sy1 TaxID=1497020 RepID=A0A098TP12_9CYAN|nr:hypothetical protein [Neosynechococcus sphagnicola]KGF74016.1 hypothetical protein DO97_00365 [Neosynechococcus sphagnicola sy1]
MSVWILAAGLLLLTVLRVMGAALLWAVVPDQIHDPSALQGFIGTLAQVLSGVLGFTISVVAIVVQLSADRFTPKVTELFLREKTNFFMILFLIIANLVSVWTSLVFSVLEKPVLLILINLILGTLSFLILIPYFILFLISYVLLRLFAKLNNKFVNLLLALPIALGARQKFLPFMINA